MKSVDIRIGNCIKTVYRNTGGQLEFVLSRIQRDFEKFLVRVMVI